MSSRRFGSRMVSLLVWALALVGAGAALAQQDRPPATGSSTTAPPIDLMDPAVIEAGKDIFRRSCTTYCHGREGRGGGHRGPTLRNGNFENAYLFQTIASGRASMPGFSRVYEPEQIWQVIAYIHSLRD